MAVLHKSPPRTEEKSVTQSDKLISMELSERVKALKPSVTLAITAKVKAMKAAGEDVIGFGAGEPDFDTPENIKLAAIDALKRGKTKYAPVQGDADARAAIAHKLSNENKIVCTPEDVIITPGAKFAIYLALQSLLDPGKNQEVLLPTPAWVSYAPMIEMAGGKAIEIPSSVENDFKITANQLADAITPKTTAVIINTPSNPCGTMYTEKELRAIGEVLANRPSIAIITDEIYEKLVYGDAHHFSLGSIRELAERTITVNGMSKAYAMTGWRIGYACAVGRGNAVIKAMTKLQGQMTNNITSFNFPAIVEAVSNSHDSVEKMRQTFANRAELIHKNLIAMPNVRCPKPTGAFYVFPDISAYFGRTTPKGTKITSALTFAEALLDEARVAVVPGEDFGECARNHVRFSFACSEKDITEGCRRMHEWLKKLK